MEYVARLPSDGPSHPDTKSAEKGIEGGMRGDSTELSLWEGEVVMRRGGWETNHFKVLLLFLLLSSFLSSPLTPRPSHGPLLLRVKRIPQVIPSLNLPTTLLLLFEN